MDVCTEEKELGALKYFKIFILDFYIDILNSVKYLKNIK